MAELDQLELTTRQEKIVGFTIAAVSVVAHVLFLVGGFRHLFPEEEKKEKQLMIVRRIPDMALEPPAPMPMPPMQRVYQQSEAVVEKGRPPESGSQQSKETQKKPTSNLPEQLSPEETGPQLELKENTLSVMTDLEAAFFRIEGPQNFKGAGTFWEKKNLPTGEYKVTFGTVEGYQTPEPQTATLHDKSAVSFVGRYTKMTQISVNTNIPNATYKIIRPDGQYLDLQGKRLGQFKDLPYGTYTIVFNDIPGYGTPSPQSRNLGPGGTLSFSGLYTALSAGGGPIGLPGIEEKKKTEKIAVKKTEGPVLDRRIKMIVTSYPQTSIEYRYGAVAYPETAIRKANYQEGWCQVYLILAIDARGNISDIEVQRPRAAERDKFTLLVDTVERSVREWDFDRARAEVHVDVRFFVEK